MIGFFLSVKDPSKTKRKSFRTDDKKRESLYGKVKLEEEGGWGPKHTYYITHLNEVLSVECELIDL